MTFFVASFIIGHRDWFGKLKWLAGPVFGLMYAMSGCITSVTAESVEMRSVVWPDFAKLPIGLLLSMAGLAMGLLAAKKRSKEA